MMRILIAEDTVPSRRMLQKCLEGWGHSVVSTETGKEAWAAFQAQPASMVISDWLMPEMDGMELLRLIRSTPEKNYVYVILLTAKAQREDLIAAMDAGADDFLKKPFDREELRVRLGAAQRVLDMEQKLNAQKQSLLEQNAQLRTANAQMQKNLRAATMAGTPVNARATLDGALKTTNRGTLTANENSETPPES